jgi:hypothetical protein
VCGLYAQRTAPASFAAACLPDVSIVTCVNIPSVSHSVAGPMTDGCVATEPADERALPRQPRTRESYPPQRWIPGAVGSARCSCHAITCPARLPAERSACCSLRVPSFVLVVRSTESRRAVLCSAFRCRVRHRGPIDNV